MPTRKSNRRLRPEIAAELIARNREEKLKELYQKPIDALDPEDLQRMKQAFFRS